MSDVLPSAEEEGLTDLARKLVDQVALYGKLDAPTRNYLQTVLSRTTTTHDQVSALQHAI